MMLTTSSCGRKAVLASVVKRAVAGSQMAGGGCAKGRCVCEKRGRGQCGGEMAVEGSVNMAKKGGGRAGLVV